MDLSSRSPTVVTRAVDLLRAAGATMSILQTKTIDADEHEAISLELTGKMESRLPELWLISGNHEDLGWTVLRREDGVFTVEAEDVSFVRSFGQKMQRSDARQIAFDNGHSRK